MTGVNSISPANARISAWLFFMCALVMLMVIVGGATRLTDSGLSITEWKPVTGALPPLSEAHWLSEFEKYQRIPEYEQINFGMSLDEFKFIYWWEWGHRFLGRLIGFAFFVPFVFFLVSRQLSRGLAVKLFGLLLLGGLQGFMGWYMVKSGLSERVDVSQYRLAAHLSLAVILFALMAWIALDLRFRDRAHEGVALRPKKPMATGAFLLTGAIFIQIILGAFVAGLRAGSTFNSWPLMDGQFFPAAYFSATPKFADIFESVAAVQFNHRLWAYVTFAAAILFFLKARATPIMRYAGLLLFAVSAQAILGIFTLVLHTPLWLGLLHQAGAILVLFMAIVTAHRAYRFS